MKSVNETQVDTASHPWLPEPIRQIALWQRRLIWTILLGFVVILMPGQWLAMLAVVLLQLWVLLRLAKALELRRVWLWAIGCLVPYGGLIVLLVLNGKATKALRQAGLKVGFMGARLSKQPRP